LAKDTVADNHDAAAGVFNPVVGTAAVVSPKVGIEAVDFGQEVVAANVFIRSQSF
jgi:hypothetical protein